MNVTRIAVRNIARQKKRSILLGGAIAFGVMIITLIGSFSRGLADTASSNFTDILGGHLYVTGQELTATGGQVSVIRERAVLEETLALIDDDILDRSIRSRAFAEVIFGSTTARISIEGVSWADEPELIAGLHLVAGEVCADLDAHSLVLPASTAEELGIEIGESVLVRTSTVTGQQNVAEFQVCAISDDDSAFAFSFAYADHRYLNEIIGIGPEEYQVLNITLADPTMADSATEILMTRLASLGKTEPESDEEETGMAAMRSRMMAMGSLMGGSSMFGGKIEEADRWEGTRFNVLNINDMMESVTAMVNVLNTVGYVIFAILMVITMVGLLNTFRMILIERTQEIGTMRAMGMQRGEVRNIFLTEAMVLAIGGAVLGMLIAVGLSGIIGLIPLSSESPLQIFLSDGSFSFPIVPASLVATFVIISAVTIASAYLPARKAAKLDPAVALRTTY